MRSHASQAVLAALAALLSVPALAPAARADVTVTVLSLSSLEGDDEFARNLSGALRNAAAGVRGWVVDRDREVALSQMEMMHDCVSSDTICMTQIAAALNTQRVIYGTIQRSPIGTRYEFQVTLFLFDAESGEVVERVVETIPSSSIDIDALRDPARAIIERISASMRPGSIRVVGRAGAAVTIDGQRVGTIPASGEFLRPEVDAGTHAVVIEGEPEQTIEVAGGTEARVAFAGRSGGGGGGGGGSVLPWVGVGLLGLAAVSAGVWIYSMAAIDSLSSDADYRTYRESVGTLDPTATNVCQEAFYTSAASGAVGRSTCSEGATLEILQYVFLGLTVVSAGAGGALLAVGMGENSSGSGEPSARLRLEPTRLTIDF